MAFVTEIVLFRARPSVVVETVVAASESTRPANAGPDGTIDCNADRFMQVIDGPGVRLYHFRSRSL